MNDPGARQTLSGKRRSAVLDQLAILEEERSFLLRSLRDLEAERKAGDVDEHDYAALRDGYTKRAAAVLVQIDAGRAALAAPRRVDWTRRLAIIGAVVLIASGLGWFVARSAGDRAEGQELSGGAPIAERADVGVLLSEARSLMSSGAFPAARDRYQRVLEIDRDHPEARTYIAWIVFLGSEAADADVRDQAVDAARETLETVAADHPDYPDAHCLVAVIYWNHYEDADLARRSAERCLELDPPGQLEGLVRRFIEGLPGGGSTVADENAAIPSASG